MKNCFGNKYWGRIEWKVVVFGSIAYLIALGIYSR
jgi:hypothetical protein